MSSDDTDDDRPDFGPQGYLPDRAARRARKIVLRAPLGAQWIVGALVVGAVVVVAGVLALRPSVPSAPYLELPASVLPATTGGEPVVASLDDQPVVVLGVLGRPRVFDWSAPTTGLPAYCAESGLLEADGGAAWRATGRGLDGTPSLVELPTVVVDGRVFADPTDPLPPLDPDEDSSPTRGCTDLSLVSVNPV